MIHSVGWCAQFGPEIGAACSHVMVAGDQRCICPECGVVCEGRFRACPEVWAKGPENLVLLAGHNGQMGGIVRPAAALSGESPGQGSRPPTASPEERADFLAEVVGIVESKVASLGQRLEEKEETRLQALLAEINTRIDDLARAASPPDPKPARRASSTGSTASKRPSRKVVGMTPERTKGSAQTAEDRESPTG
jgi:hypothetical protein